MAIRIPPPTYSHSTPGAKHRVPLFRSNEAVHNFQRGPLVEALVAGGKPGALDGSILPRKFRDMAHGSGVFLLHAKPYDLGPGTGKSFLSRFSGAHPEFRLREATLLTHGGVHTSGRVGDTINLEYAGELESHYIMMGNGWLTLLTPISGLGMGTHKVIARYRVVHPTSKLKLDSKVP